MHQSKGKSMKKFKHSGHLGDIISGLPAIIQLGGGQLFISDKPCVAPPLVLSEVVPMLRPLLESQPYIKSVEGWSNQEIDYDMDTFRDRGYNLAKDNLAECQLKNFNLTYDLTQKWLNVPPIYKADIVINRTVRYHNPDFNWNKVLNSFPDQKILFVGLQNEYDAFNHKEIEFYQVKDFLELASIIAGSKLFIGNQSFCWWLAEAMKVNRWQETCSYTPNSLPYTNNGKAIRDTTKDIEDRDSKAEIWNNENFTRLYNMVFRDNPIKKYMEIGVQEGRAVDWMIKHASSLEKIVLCDTWGNEYGGTGKGNHNHIITLLQNEGYPLENAIFLDGDSSNLIPEYFVKNKDEMFDLIFVDGDHSEKGARTDILNTINHTKVLAIHDIYHPIHFEILGMVKEIYNNNRDAFFLMDDGVNTILLVRK